MSGFKKFVLFILSLIFVGILVLLFLYVQLSIRVEKLAGSSSSPEIIEQQDEDVYRNKIATISGVIFVADQLQELQASSEALLKRVEELEQDKPTTKYVTTGTVPAFQKQIVHIGSASTRENDWINSGVEVTLNTADYPSNVNATFEVGISIVSGEGWARLINKTTGAIMAITEVSSIGSATVWKTSPEFKLHSGTNTYELQVRSSSREQAEFSSARIILTN